jgi:hypothetical protein
MYAKNRKIIKIIKFACDHFDTVVLNAKIKTCQLFIGVGGNLQPMCHPP